MAGRTDGKTTVPAVLPVARIEGTAYLIDLESRFFREALYPGRYVDFDTVKGRTLCGLAGVITCLRCGTSVIMATSMKHVDLRCVCCGAFIRDPEPQPADEQRLGGEK